MGVATICLVSTRAAFFGGGSNQTLIFEILIISAVPTFVFPYREFFSPSFTPIQHDQLQNEARSVYTYPAQEKDHYLLWYVVPAPEI
jgi:hypothetical protein